MIAFFRKWHRILGVSSAVFIVMLAITGIFLNHPTLFFNNPSQSILSVHPSPISSSELWITKQDGLFITDLDYSVISQITLPYPAKDIVDIVHIPGHMHPSGSSRVLLAFKQNVILTLLKQRPLVWGSLTIPDNDHTMLSTLTYSAKGLYLKTDKAIYFSPFEDDSWYAIQSFPFGFKEFVKGLHTGYLFKPLLLIFNDLSAIILVVLVVTGFFLFRRR